MKLSTVLALVALAGACAPLPPPPPPPYHAIGTEPFWNLLIDEHNLTFTRPDAQPILQPTPQVIHGIAGEIYQSPRINVNIVQHREGDGLRFLGTARTVQLLRSLGMPFRKPASERS